MKLPWSLRCCRRQTDSLRMTAWQQCVWVVHGRRSQHHCAGVLMEDCQGKDFLSSAWPGRLVVVELTVRLWRRSSRRHPPDTPASDAAYNITMYSQSHAPNYMYKRPYQYLMTDCIFLHAVDCVCMLAYDCSGDTHGNNNNKKKNTTEVMNKVIFGSGNDPISLLIVSSCSCRGRRSSKMPKSPSFQMGSGWK